MSQVPNRQPQVLSTAGAIAPSGLNFILSIASPPAALAMTLAPPTADGLQYEFVSQDTQAHTLVCTGALNGGTSLNKLTWGGTKSASVTITSLNGFWWSSSLNGVTVS